MNTITAAFYVKNERECLRGAIQSVREHVDQILVWDTGSTDDTLETVKDLVDRAYRLSVPPEAIDFGEMETIVTSLAHTDWVLKLDADERLTNAGLLKVLAMNEDYGAWRFPRRRWADLAMTKQLELSAWPDFQYRFFWADGFSRYEGLIHPEFKTPYAVGESFDVVIEHFVDVFHLSSFERREARRKLYESLALKSGKSAEGSEEAARLARGSE